MIKAKWETYQIPKKDTLLCFCFVKLKEWTVSEGFLLLFAQLHPLVSDMEYLRDQHLLLSVKSCDGFESYGELLTPPLVLQPNKLMTVIFWFAVMYICAMCLEPGECCVALQSVVTSSSESFETCLTHRGEEMGSIRGQIKIYVPPNRRQTRERIYGESGSCPFCSSFFFSSIASLYLTCSLCGLHASSSFGSSVVPALLSLLSVMASSFGSLLTDLVQMHPEAFRTLSVSVPLSLYAPGLYPRQLHYLHRPLAWNVCLYTCYRVVLL